MSLDGTGIHAGASDATNLHLTSRSVHRPTSVASKSESQLWRCCARRAAGELGRTLQGPVPGAPVLAAGAIRPHQAIISEMRWPPAGAPLDTCCPAPNLPTSNQCPICLYVCWTWLAGGGTNTEHRAHSSLGLAWIMQVHQGVGKRDHQTPMSLISI